MRLKKTLFSTILCIIILASNSIAVFAREVHEENSTEQYEIILSVPSFEEDDKNIIDLVPQMARGFYEPTEAHNWDDGRMNFEGDTSTTTHLYTEKYFTDFTEGYLYVNSSTAYQGYPRGDVTVRMYRKGLLTDTLIFKEEIKAGDELSLKLWNYDPDKKYYLQFSGTFHVSGYVSRTK